MAKAVVWFVLLSAGIYWILDRGLRVPPGLMVHAVMRHDDECILVDWRGRPQATTVTRGVTVGDFLAVLALNGGQWGRRTLCAFADSVDEDVLRWLRMSLRIPAGDAGRRSPSIGYRLLRQRRQKDAD